MRKQNLTLMPTLIAGVQVRQLSLDSAQIVGEIDQPVALDGVNGDAVEWLRQLDGQRSWSAQLDHAQAIGMDRDAAIVLLTSLRNLGIVVHRPTSATADTFADVGVIGAERLAKAVVSVVEDSQYLGPVPRPTLGAQWRLSIEDLADSVAKRPIILALAGTDIDAAEYELLRHVQQSGAASAVVGAGVCSARVGPIVLPGASPCVRCDELVKESLDPTWRTVSAQLAVDGVPPADPMFEALAAAELARHLAQVRGAAVGEVQDGGSQVGGIGSGGGASGGMQGHGGISIACGAVLTSGRSGGPWQVRRIRRHASCSCWWSGLGPKAGGGATQL